VVAQVGSALVKERSSVFIDAPLVLVSQIQRSGGSLLAQLFDGHPQVYAHPLEIRIWHPKKSEWPALDPAGDPSGWFDALHNEKWTTLAKDGFAKPGSNPAAAEQRHPFTFSADEQRSLFLDLVASRPVRRQRDILDCYFTSFFRSWGEWQPTGRELVITGFMPRVVMLPDGLARFRSDYPDGKLISIVRDPRSWYASSSRHRSRHEDLEFAVGEWIQSARAIAEIVRSGEPWAMGVVFDELVLEPESMLRRVAAFVGIEFDASLLEPSYLGRPVLPNSSFEVREYGINTAMVRRKDEIPPEAEAHIAGEALPLYEELVELLAAPAGSGLTRG
jgi:hypothetical protein